MNWDDLRLLLAIRRSGSLTGAARLLGVNQSTVSRRIISVETGLGCKLVERQPDGAVLTEAAGELCSLAEKTETGLALAVGRVRRGAAEVSGQLTVTCVDMMVDRFLAPLLAELRAEHPKLQLSVLAGLEAVDLMRGKADVALRVSRAPDEALMGKRLCDFGLGVYRARDIADVPQGWIGWTDGRRIEVNLPDFLTRVETLHHADSFLAMNAMVRAGMGMAVLPCYWADADDSLCRVHPRPVSYPDLGLWLLYHPDRKQLPRVRAFVDLVSRRVAQRRALFAGCPVADQGLA